jgi:hypothetical protein
LLETIRDDRTMAGHDASRTAHQARGNADKSENVVIVHNLIPRPFHRPLHRKRDTRPLRSTRRDPVAEDGRDGARDNVD